MKFISLTMMIISAIMPVLGAVTVAKVTPDGMPCDKPGQYECGLLAGYNNGNAFLYECEDDFKIHDLIDDCSCPTCCSVTNGGLVLYKIQYYMVNYVVRANGS
ncbi:uncharacterized protein EDB93DRAFT_1335283 [Suillus bovinus]|uniref:uncharacterized protein n=1 Tax=Suillus bovinus TaxID=48563 RepID=UPI001B871D44|nr:uncharacterized protein EDB93DRAFT_1335283 [Suillus bovinus]KAG2156841.1 hypothetical protein EDB93DRAFT_1335283 [Suillus bovinus]